jgi:glycosyltransferase involved in cell wall biosynthesis
MSTTLISVALPVFNGSNYIESAIRSLLSQGDDVEIVVSDDCSTDNTVEIIKTIDAKNIRLITNRNNGGQFTNFNRAIRECSGSHIQMFSHDDIAHIGFISSQIKAFGMDSRVGLVYASCNIINDQDRRLSVCDDEGTPLVVDFPTYLRISSRYGALPPSISTVMVRREVLETVGMFEERFSVAGDLEFYNRVAERFAFARNRSLTIDVRGHSGSVTSGSLTPIKFMNEELEILPYYRRHLGEQGYQEMIKRRAHHRGVSHAKDILRRAAAGDIIGFIQGYRALSQVHNIPQCLLFAAWQKFFPER